MALRVKKPDQTGLPNTTGSGDCSDRLDEMGALAYGVDGHHNGVVPA